MNHFTDKNEGAMCMLCGVFTVLGMAAFIAAVVYIRAMF